mmetsp:Transcript_53148/g.124464  ORF Transcript_53148/g.124464 Transcript_53148/m.124464 type:complete len:225 (+) Transcript_53148:230-904(+)
MAGRQQLGAGLAPGAAAATGRCRGASRASRHQHPGLAAGPARLSRRHPAGPGCVARLRAQHRHPAVAVDGRLAGGEGTAALAPGRDRQVAGRGRGPRAGAPGAAGPDQPALSVQRAEQPAGADQRRPGPRPRDAQSPVQHPAPHAAAQCQGARAAGRRAGRGARLHRAGAAAPRGAPARGLAGGPGHRGRQRAADAVAAAGGKRHQAWHRPHAGRRRGRHHAAA